MTDSLPSLRVLYIEDVTESADAVRTYLQSLNYEVLPVVASLAEALAAIKADAPNIVLVDLHLEAEGGDLVRAVNFILELKRTHPKITILVHSADARIRIDIVRAIVAAGVSYLIKEAVENPEHIDRAIKHARTGGVIYDRHIVKLLDQIAASKAPSLLTEREWQVAELVAEQMTNPQIADQLHLSVPRVAELVSSILGKLDFTRRGQIIIWYKQQRGSTPLDANHLNTNAG